MVIIMKKGMLIAVLCFMSLTGLCEAWMFSGYDVHWDGLCAGFSINPFSGFTDLPRTVEDAIYDGWAQDAAVGCNVEDQQFNGNRYLKDNDTAIMLLYDKNGYIAGIQAGIPKTGEYPKKLNAKYNTFQEESDKWVITAYFVEPATICTTGRNETQYAREGTGTMLTVQNGPTASHLIRLPMTQGEVTPQSGFAEGKCFWSMGMHYWHNMTKDTPCDDIFPFFLLFDDGKLIAFGWSFEPNFENSNTWEHPGPSVFGKFMKEPPTCLGTVTTLHIYMTSHPRWIFC